MISIPMSLLVLYEVVPSEMTLSFVVLIASLKSVGIPKLCLKSVAVTFRVIRKRPSFEASS